VTWMSLTIMAELSEKGMLTRKLKAVSSAHLRTSSC